MRNPILMESPDDPQTVDKYIQALMEANGAAGNTASQPNNPGSKKKSIGNFLGRISNLAMADKDITKEMSQLSHKQLEKIHKKAQDIINAPDKHTDLHKLAAGKILGHQHSIRAKIKSDPVLRNSGVATLSNVLDSEKSLGLLMKQNKLATLGTLGATALLTKHFMNKAAENKRRQEYEHAMMMAQMPQQHAPHVSYSYQPQLSGGGYGY